MPGYIEKSPGLAAWLASNTEAWVCGAAGAWADEVRMNIKRLQWLQQNNAVSSEFDKIPGPTGIEIPDPLLASIIQNVVWYYQVRGSWRIQNKHWSLCPSDTGVSWSPGLMWGLLGHSSLHFIQNINKNFIWISLVYILLIMLWGSSAVVSSASGSTVAWLGVSGIGVLVPIEKY